MLTRDPTGRQSGRKAVLATAALSLESLGLRVEAVVVSRQAPAPSWEGRPLHHVPLPGIVPVGLSALGVLLLGRGTFNEALFDSRAVRRRTRRVAQRLQPELVVADGLRTTRPAFATGAPVLVHLDDLLSDRYAVLQAGSTNGTDLLGFFGPQIPGLLRPVAGRLATRLLGLESRRANARERQVTREAAVVAMTSRDEADVLDHRTGRTVVSLPMAVDVRPAGDPAAAPACSFVFLGDLDYGPNRDALRWWAEHVRPALDIAGGSDVMLTVVGHSTPGLAGDSRLVFTGYVDDLGTELARHRGMVAPVLSGAGVKTKVLDGWSTGLPVVATPAGAAGLAPGQGMIVESEPAAFAAAVLRLRDDAGLAARLGADGRRALEQDWSSVALARRWAQAVQPLR